MSNSAKKIRATLLGAFMSVAPALLAAQGENKTAEPPVNKEPQEVVVPDHVNRDASVSGNKRDSAMVTADTMRVSFTENADSSGTGGESPDGKAAKNAERAAKKAELLTDPVREGNVLDAENASFYNIIAIHVSGGTQNEPYTAKEYAQMLEMMFKDTAYTDHPTQVVVFYEESGKDRPTAMSVEINGMTYDKNGGRHELGDAAFTPNDFVSLGHLKKVTEQYFKETTPGMSYEPAPGQ